jgi:hypothetical protein
MWEFANEHPEATFLIVVVLACAATAPFFFALLAYNQMLRSRNIVARGWPPPHLNADGDVIEKEEEEDAEVRPNAAENSPAVRAG